MALGSTWWSSTWRGNRLPSAAAFEASDITLETVSDLWQMLRVSGEHDIYQRDYHFGGNHDFDNGGSFYIKNDVTGELTPAADTFKEHNPLADVMLPASSSQGDIEPFEENQDVIYVDPFSTSSIYPSTWSAILTNKPPAASGDSFSVVHRCPWAWYGSPSQVIASILLSLGVASTQIDTTAVDNAYDGEEADHGASGIYAPRVSVARVVGQAVIDTIKLVARHGWSRVGYTMAGLLACWSATRPVEYAADDLAGIKGLVSWRLTDDHLFNQIDVTHGAVCRSSAAGSGVAPTIIEAGVEVPNPDYTFRSAWDENLSSAQSDLWVTSDSDATSQTAYGVLPLGGKDAKPLHLPCFYDAASPTGMAARVDKFCQPLHELTLTQDFRGLDYEVGTLITDYEFPDGVTCNLFCISKEIDFNTLTVTSTLLEDL